MPNEPKFKVGQNVSVVHPAANIVLSQSFVVCTECPEFGTIVTDVDTGHDFISDGETYYYYISGYGDALFPEQYLREEGFKASFDELAPCDAKFLKDFKRMIKFDESNQDIGDGPCLS